MSVSMLVCSCLALLVPSIVRRKCKEGAIYSITRTRTQELISISIHFSRSICLFPLRPGFRPSYPLPAKANSSHSESNASLFLVSFPAPTTEVSLRDSDVAAADMQTIEDGPRGEELEPDNNPQAPVLQQPEYFAI